MTDPTPPARRSPMEHERDAMAPPPSALAAAERRGYLRGLLRGYEIAREEAALSGWHMRAPQYCAALKQACALACAVCGWTGRRKPGRVVTCPRCGSVGAFQ